MTTGGVAQLDDEAYDELVAPSFTEYIGAMFELVCQNARPDLVPKTYRGIDYWWHRGHEIDVVGLASDGTLGAGECIYTTREMHEGDLADLERSATQVDWTPPERGDPDHHHCCFCRSGLSEGLRRAAADRADVSLFTPEDIVGELVH